MTCGGGGGGGGRPGDRGGGGAAAVRGNDFSFTSPCSAWRVRGE